MVGAQLFGGSQSQLLSRSPVPINTGSVIRIHEWLILEIGVEETLTIGLLRREGEKRHRPRVGQIDRRFAKVA